jgi:hypothetical protein
MFYFGLAVATRSVSPITQQTGDMQWDAVQTVQWLIEGTFALTASLIAPGGGTLWSEGFFVHVAAPYNLLAAVPILLILVLIYEIYNVATSGSQEKGSKSKGKAPPASSPSASGTGTASTPAQGAGEPPAGGGTT